MQKISEYKLRQYGQRGVSLTIPRVFANDNDIKFGYPVQIFRGNIDGIDSLIIQPKATPNINKEILDVNNPKEVKE
jgi:hypothetical protein